ncbi:phosphohydrolase, partial [SCandidatus Aminicenantes bacterium Aminicenantia_JdfR_composite]|nr:phosphohydrolase [SCandidatus Aminicenantes bacterium Aminicenantia_JdfR_composite]
HILHLADRVAVAIKRKEEILGQVKGICERIEKNSGKMFMPELVDAFKNLATKEYFWLEAISPSISSILAHKSKSIIIELDVKELLDLAKLFCQIIDFRSRFTA